MKRKLLFVAHVVLLLLFVSAFNIPNVKSSQMLSTTIWSHTYGGKASDYAYSLVQTEDGGFVLTGFTQSFGVGNSDFWLVKTDSFGDAQWNKTYGGVNDESAYSVVVTDDGGYALAGYTRSFGVGGADFWLVKTDSSGNQQWNRTYGETGNDYARSVVQTADGGYALAGYTESFDMNSEDDFWLVKTDSSGNQQWNKTYGGRQYYRDYGDIAWSMVQAGDGGYVLAGLTWSYGIGGNGDFWLVKTDSFGNVQWNMTYGGGDYDYALSVIQAGDGGYVLAGLTYSFGVNGDFWLVKTDSFGNQQWNKTYGGTKTDYASSIIQANDGGYVLAGYTYSYGVGNGDFWLVKTDSFGNLQWNRTFGGTKADYAFSLVQTVDGGFALAGVTQSFGAGNGDFWLVKTDENGIAPEFPSFFMLPLLATVILFVIILTKKKSPKTPKHF
jgi:hypothetical protein